MELKFDRKFSTEATAQVVEQTLCTVIAARTTASSPHKHTIKRQTKLDN
jgi:hypothetical protein